MSLHPVDANGNATCQTVLSDAREVLRIALDYRSAGLSVIPVKTDGSKAPALSSWTAFMVSLASESRIRSWFSKANPPGIGIACGKASSNLELLDFDAEADRVFAQWKALVDAEEPGLVDRLTRIRTAGGGFHVPYRVQGEPVPGSLKLALDPARPTDDQTLIETRGQGGMFVAPGSPPAVHETRKPYRHLDGPPLLQVATVADAERAVLIRCARIFDRREPKKTGSGGRAEAAQQKNNPKDRQPGELRPGEDFDKRGTWSEVLTPHGWHVVGEANGKTLWARPGKDKGWSATTGFCTGKDGADLLHVFSSNAHPFEDGKSYGKFRALALLDHGGNASAAARELAGQGYGQERRARAAGIPHGNAVARVESRLPAAEADEPPAAPVPDPDVFRLELITDPHRLARIYRASVRIGSDDTLFRYCGEYLAWRAGRYVPMTDEAIKAGGLTVTARKEFELEYDRRLEQWKKRQKNPQPEGEDGKPKKAETQPVMRPVTMKIVANVNQALVSLSMLPDRTPSPSWIGGEGPFDAFHTLSCRNMLVHLPSFVAREEPWQCPPTPRLFTRNALGYDFDPVAPAPTEWLKFLSGLWPTDPECIATLQEWFGYCLLRDTSQHKVFLLVGPPRSGKGTIARVLRELVGLDNVCAPTLASLGERFGLEPLLDKTLAIIADARLSGRTDTAIVTERILSISGEDAQTVDRKNRTSRTEPLPVRFMILSNELPRLNDASGALVSRMLVLQQSISWRGREDVNLTSRLLAELPGILLWAIEGWRRLRERGHFVVPASSADALSLLNELASPILAFVEEKCILEPGANVPKQELFKAWVEWTEGRGHTSHSTDAVFGRDLRSAFPTIQASRPREGATRIWMYSGIALRPSDDADLERDRCAEWLKHQLRGQRRRVSGIRTEAEAEGFGTDLLYKAKRHLDVEEESSDGFKWWKLPKSNWENWENPEGEL